MPSTVVDRWSFGSVAVVPYSFAASLGTASGFTVRVASGRRYLITNYHVVSGRRPDNNVVIDGAGHLPDRVLIALPQFQQGVPVMSWRPHVQALMDDAGNPAWVEHPQYGREFDAVALPLSLSNDDIGLFVDTGESENVGVFPGSTVSIVGFPNGLAGPALSAIWKTGAIASEPDLLVDGQDFFWIDANTRPGMSGSPVIARRFGSYLGADRNMVLGVGLVDRLLGVYAGRAPDAVDMTLGRVWRWRGVEELLRRAEAMLDAGDLVGIPTTLGHFSESNMPSVTNREGTIVNSPPMAAIKITVADILRQVAGADQRFGASLDRLKLAASVVASCSSAGVGTSFDLPVPAATLLAECLKVPQGWNYPQNFFQIVEMIQQAIQELESAQT